MTLKGDTKFKAKLTRGLKNGIRNLVNFLVRAILGFIDLVTGLLVNQIISCFQSTALVFTYWYITSWYLLVSKVKNRNSRTIHEICSNLWCLYSYYREDLTHCTSVLSVDFEQVKVGWIILWWKFFNFFQYETKMSLATFSSIGDLHILFIAIKQAFEIFSKCLPIIQVYFNNFGQIVCISNQNWEWYICEQNYWNCISYHK